VAAAGILIVRDGRVLLSPRPHGELTHLGWIGGAVERGESAAEAARREAREEIGCDVELVHAPVTYEAWGPAELTPLAPLLRTPEAAVYRARPLGEPQPVDVPALVWVPLALLPQLEAPRSVAWLLAHGAETLGDLGERDVIVADGTATGLLRHVVARFGADAVEPS
jgi:8-oxo-dGTP pyrophosphatase MutT (NUDIX family)